MPSPAPTLRDTERAALEALLAIAATNTGQAKKVADFLLAWWNTDDCGGFDPTDLWAVDERIAADMLCVIACIARTRAYPDTLGYKAPFEALVRAWRPVRGPSP